MNGRHYRTRREIVQLVLGILAVAVVLALFGWSLSACGPDDPYPKPRATQTPVRGAE